MILGFKDQFVKPIQEGVKIHTIRTGNRWKKGTKINFFGKVRQKGMYRFKEDLICTEVQQIRICYFAKYDYTVEVDGKFLSWPQLDVLAENDGFKNGKELLNFFRESRQSFTFEGQLVHWTDFKY